MFAVRLSNPQSLSKGINVQDQTSQAAIAIVVERNVQTVPKTQFGGVHDGFVILGYHPEGPWNVEIEPRPATA